MGNVARKWSVKISPEAEATMPRTLTPEDIIRIRTWAETVERHGPQVLQERPMVWDDHALEGEWAGHRASSFSEKVSGQSPDVGRIIYRIEDTVVTVVVVKITDSHDYRRKP